MLFKDRLKQLRLQLGISQAALSRKAGMSRKAINDYELGKRFPVYEILFTLAKALEVEVAELFHEKDHITYEMELFHLRYKNRKPVKKKKRKKCKTYRWKK